MIFSPRKNVPQPKRKKTIVESESNSISDMSFSQIDEGVLQELPDELREEITAHFQDIKRTVEVPRSLRDVTSEVYLKTRYS